MNRGINVKCWSCGAANTFEYGKLVFEVISDNAFKLVCKCWYCDKDMGDEIIEAITK